MITRTGEKVLWFVAGVGIGTGITFLFGTRTGKKYRRQMVRMVEDGCEQVTEAGKEVLDKGKELIETGREFVEEAGKRVGARLRVAGR
ncbi:MAG: YtxH domain-containing protein [Acidobacteria bacterium]|nr:YtxH domain-containing protein [Acidobacteriota bacterium]